MTQKEYSRIIQVTGPQASLIERLLKQVASDDPEHWETTKKEIDDLLYKITF